MHDEKPAIDGGKPIPEMRPKTLDILGRAIIISLARTFEDHHADWIIQGIWKVAQGLR